MSRYPLYFNDELKERLSKIAKAEHRSLNAQIIHILELWVNDIPEEEETLTAITSSNPGAHVQTDAERAAALKTQGDFQDKCL